MKVSELIGSLLDYWVARAEGMEINPDVCQPDNGVFVGHGGGDLEFFGPSEDWAQGGPIIERERIATSPCEDENNVHIGWVAFVDGSEHYGATPLIAAMRAYVASKYGDTVPDEVAG